MSDPVLQVSFRLNGAWFIHPTHDVVATIATVVREVAVDLGIAVSDVTFYGAPPGGFGAIGCAAHLLRSKAVAEVPQIDFDHWGPVVTRLIEDAVWGGCE